MDVSCSYILLIATLLDFLSNSNLFTTEGAKILILPNDLDNNAEFKSLVKVGETLAERHLVTILVNNKHGPGSLRNNVTVVTYALSDAVSIPETGTDLLKHDIRNSFFSVIRTEELQWALDICQALLKRQYLLIQLQFQEFDLIIADNSNLCARILIDYLQVKTIIWCYNSYDITCDLSNDFAVASSMINSDQIFSRLKHILDYIFHLNYYQPIVLFKPFDELKDQYGYNRGLSILNTFSRVKPVMILNADFSVDLPRPVMPHVVPIGGLLYTKDNEGLPADIESFFTQSDLDGLIYIDLLVSGNWFIQKQINNIFKVLNKYEQTVLVSNGINVSINFSRNFRTVSTVMHDAVLKSGRAKLMITTCKQKSAHDMAYYGIPVIFLVSFGANVDYCRNLITRHNTGKVLNILELSSEQLDEQIRNFLNDADLKKNAEQLSNAFKHQVKDSNERLFHLIDFVSIYNRVDQLHSNMALKLPWYQYCMLDLVFLLIIVGVLCLMLCITVIYFAFKWMQRLFQGRGKQKTKQS